MIIVLEYSPDPLANLPEAGRAAALKLEQRAPDQLVHLIEGLIADVADQTRYTFPTWAKLAEAAKRLLLISMIRPAIPAEVQMYGTWKASALNDTGEYGAILREISKIWANCGETTRNVLTRLRQNYGATISCVENVTFLGGQSAGVTNKLRQLPASAAEVHILDCDIEGIHNFLIEVHSDGKRYLVNGYQGGYSAIWWSSNSPYDPVDDRTDRSDVAQFRPAYGNGQDIAGLYNNFTDLLATQVQCGYSELIPNQGHKAVWRLLPFKPMDPGPLKIRDLPYLRIVVYKIRNPQAVAQAIGGPARSLCVQATLSLPIAAPQVQPAEVLAALTQLGLQASHSVDNRGANKFKVDADPSNLHPVLKGKMIMRVGMKEIERLSRADLPPTGQTIDVGYSAAGVEVVITRTVP